MRKFVGSVSNCLSGSLFLGALLSALLLPERVFAGWKMALSEAKLTTGLPGVELSIVLISIMDWLLSLVGVVAVIAFVISGLMYLTSVGDEEQAGRAKKYFIYSVTGVLVAISGLIILNTVRKVFGI